MLNTKITAGMSMYLNFISIPTEQTSAVTDLIQMLGLLIIATGLSRSRVPVADTEIGYVNR